MPLVNKLLILLVFLAPNLAAAGWMDRDGNPLPDTTSRKSVGEFGGQLLLTDKEQETFERWNTPSAGVVLSTTDKIKKNEFISVLIVFSGCMADSSGNCDLVVKFKVLQPDGSVYADLPTQEAWVGKPAPGKSLQMSAGYIKIRIEDNEPLGVYEVIAELLDKVSGTTLSLSSKFEAID